MSLKIIGGRFKGRSLKTPPSSSTRPTQGMLREALFNICQNSIEGACFLDLFAGSGAVGLEALSRGATHATLIESNRQAIHCIQENIQILQVETEATLFPMPAERAVPLLSKQKKQFDLIYIDPPYEQLTEKWIELLLSFSLLKAGAFVFIEERYNPKNQKAPPTFASLSLKESRRFGIALLHRYHFTAC